MPLAFLANLLKDPRALLTLFGGLGGFAFRDRSIEQRQRQIAHILSAGNVEAQTKIFAELLRGSPIFSQAQREIAIAGNTGQTAAAQSLAERGLTGSGLGAMLTSAANSSTGFKLGELNAETLREALKAALGQTQQQASTLAGLPIQPQAGSQIFSNLLGALSLSYPSRANSTGERPIAAAVRPNPRDNAFGGFRLAPRSGAPSYYDFLSGGLP